MDTSMPRSIRGTVDGLDGHFMEIHLLEITQPGYDGLHISTSFNIFQHLSTSFNIFQHLSTSLSHGMIHPQ